MSPDELQPLPGPRRGVNPHAEIVPAENVPAQPADRWASRIAIGAVGLGLVAFLIGAALIAAGGKPVPTQYWSTGSAISGALIGILAPTPRKLSERSPQTAGRVRTVLAEIAALLEDLWKNRQLLILVVVFAASATLAVTQSSAAMETVAAAAGGALIGLLAPSPA
jgi:Na+/melibiose symporter-like transporter